MLKMIKRGAVAVGGAVSTGLALADTSAAVTAVTAAQTEALAIVAALTTMGIAIWGGMFVYRKFFKG